MFRIYLSSSFGLLWTSSSIFPFNFSLKYLFISETGDLDINHCCFAVAYSDVRSVNISFIYLNIFTIVICILMHLMNFSQSLFEISCLLWQCLTEILLSPKMHSSIANLTFIYPLSIYLFIYFSATYWTRPLYAVQVLPLNSILNPTPHHFNYYLDEIIFFYPFIFSLYIFLWLN